MRMVLFAGLASLHFALGVFGNTACAAPERLQMREVLAFPPSQSGVFLEASRRFQAVVPKEHDPARAACLLIRQDGVADGAPGVFDTLLASGEIPVGGGGFIEELGGVKSIASGLGPGRPPAGSQALQKLLIPGEPWKQIGEGYRSLAGPATNAAGELFFNDVSESKTFRLDATGKVEPFIEESGRGKGQAFGPDGRLYAVAAGENKIVAYTPDGSMQVVAEGFCGYDLTVRYDGKIYVTEPNSIGSAQSRIWLISPDGMRVVVDTGLKFCSGIALSPDQSQLYVADAQSDWIYRFQVQPDGELTHKQQFLQIMVPDAANDSGADGIKVDRDGKIYVATRTGIQVCDPAGRVQCILPAPNGKVSNIAFGGSGGDILYAVCGNKLFQRRLRARGVEPYAAH